MKKWIIALVAVVILGLALDPNLRVLASGVTGAAYNTILNAGTPVTQRPGLNFTTSGCVDNAGQNRTDCTPNIAFQQGGAGLGNANTLNLVAGTGISLSNALAAGVESYTISASGGAGGGGVLGFSAGSVVLPGAGTTFLAPVGGAPASTTETNVTALAPVAAAISKMYVSLSAAPGVGNTIAFTFRDAAVSTALTCTISGAVATTCNDATHSFTPVVGDALAIQVVTTGTVAITPTLKIIAAYGLAGGGGGGASVGTFASLPAETDGATYKTTDGPFTFIGSAAAWVPFANGIKATLPVAGSYTWANQGTASESGTNGGLIMTIPPAATNSFHIRYLTAAQTAPYTITAQLALTGNTAANPVLGGLCFYNSQSTALITFTMGTLNSNGTLLPPGISIINWTNPTTFSSVSYGGNSNGAFPFQSSAIWLRLNDDNTNYNYSVSVDGVNYSTVFSAARGSFLTPDKVGYCSENTNSSNAANAFLWLLSWIQT